MRNRRRAQAAAAGWTLERRARQARIIQRWKPWLKSTGPRSVSGRARSSQNAIRHGGRSEAVRRLARVLRLLERTEKGYA